jgi:hypothetical protein
LVVPQAVSSLRELTKGFAPLSLNAADRSANPDVATDTHVCRAHDVSLFWIKRLSRLERERLRDRQENRYVIVMSINLR